MTILIAERNFLGGSEIDGNTAPARDNADKESSFCDKLEGFLPRKTLHDFVFLHCCFLVSMLRRHD